MAGGIILAIVLLLFPFVVTISGIFIAMVLGETLRRNAEATHEGSEYLETNY